LCSAARQPCDLVATLNPPVCSRASSAAAPGDGAAPRWNDAATATVVLAAHRGASSSRAPSVLWLTGLERCGAWRWCRSQVERRGDGGLVLAAHRGAASGVFLGVGGATHRPRAPRRPERRGSQAERRGDGDRVLACLPWCVLGCGRAAVRGAIRYRSRVRASVGGGVWLVVGGGGARKAGPRRPGVDGSDGVVGVVAVPGFLVGWGEEGADAGAGDVAVALVGLEVVAVPTGGVEAVEASDVRVAPCSRCARTAPSRPPQRSRSPTRDPGR
jgi:hypothetical protein